MKKKQIEIALIVLLILLMYLQSSLLNTFSKSVLGKAAMIFAIIYITQNFGRNAGILSALIMTLNLYNAEKTEGFDVKEKKPDQKAQKPQKPQDTNANKIQKEQQIEKRAQELSKKKPAADLQSYVEEADGDGIPDPETWMSPESLAKFKAYVKKIKKKRDAEVTTQTIAEDKSQDNKEEKKLQEAFINHMLAPKSIQGIDRQLKKVAEYNKIAVASQGNEFAAGKFGYVKRPF